MKRIAVFIILAQFLMLTACSEKVDDISESCLIFDKEGKITNVIVDTFAQDYYTEEGLSAFLNERVDDFNDSTPPEEDITITDISIEDGMARATLLFESPDVYSRFYGYETFYGTVNDAYDAGYFLEITLKARDSSKTIMKESIMQMRDKHIIIVSEPIVVKSPGKILYSSANVEIIDEKHVRISSDSSGLAYILTE